MAKSKKQRKKWPWLLLAAVIILFSVAAYFGLPQSVASHLKVLSKGCVDPVFTKPPIDFESLESITPLGNLNPSDHTIPTDHVYIGLPAVQNTHNEDNLPPPALKITEVYAPGSLIIENVEQVEYLGAGGLVKRADYTVNFAPCRSISGYYGHLSALSPELLAQLEKKKRFCDEYNINSAGATRVRRCGASLGQAMKPGELIGRAGGQFSSFDLGLMDERRSKLTFIKPARYHGGYLKTVCPIDYYPEETKQKIAAYFGLKDKKRTIQPVCGEIMQDVPGTAQGNWFFGNVKDGPEGWSKEVSLVHDNFDPSYGVMSVGGTISGPFRLQFTPTHSGTLNREFSEIKPGNELYCYPNSADSYGIDRGQQVVLQLVDADHLKIEFQSGSCSEPHTFSNPKIYER